MNIDSIKKVLNTETGAELRKYLAGKALELDSVQALKGSPQEIGIEVLAQKKAFSKVVEILSEIGVWSQPLKTPKEVEENKFKDNFGPNRPYSIIN